MIRPRRGAREGVEGKGGQVGDRPVREAGEGAGWGHPALDNPGRALGLPVTLTVSCRVARRGRGVRHPVTIDERWQLTTPHDLEAEAVAVALGGYHSCVELAHQVLPATAELLLARARLNFPGARVATPDEWIFSEQWRLADPAPYCSCRTGFRELAQLADHLRSAMHWSRRFGCSTGDVERLVVRLADAGVQTADRPEPPLIDLPDPAHPATGDPRFGYRELIVEPSGARTLWRNGIHPAWVPVVHRRLSPDGAALPAALYLAVVNGGARLPWLTAFLPFGPQILTWAAGTHRAADLADPKARLRWLRAGARPRDIVALLDGQVAFERAREVAAGLDTNLTTAANLLARWVELKVQPEPGAFVAAYRRGGNLGFVPSVLAVGRVDFDTRALEPSPTREDAALALVTTGTAAAATTLLRKGIRPSKSMTTEACQTRPGPQETR